MSGSFVCQVSQPSCFSSSVEVFFSPLFVFSAIVVMAAILTSLLCTAKIWITVTTTKIEKLFIEICYNSTGICSWKDLNGTLPLRDLFLSVTKARLVSVEGQIHIISHAPINPNVFLPQKAARVGVLEFKMCPHFPFFIRYKYGQCTVLLG